MPTLLSTHPLPPPTTTIHHCHRQWWVAVVVGGGGLWQWGGLWASFGRQQWMTVVGGRGEKTFKKIFAPTELLFSINGGWVFGSNP